MTAAYWERRYATGGHSGAGSRGREAQLKGRLLSAVLRRHAVRSLLDLGCGDGMVASLLTPPERYVGYDPSPTAVARCRARMPARTFTTVLPTERFDAICSIDVLFHLVEDADYRAYLAALFGAQRLVIVYSTDELTPGRPHVRHRHWLADVPAGWTLAEHRRVTARKHLWVFTRAAP